MTGLKEDMQEVLKTSLPQLQYSRDGDTWAMTVITPTVTREYRFQNGQTLNMVSIDGRAVKVGSTISVHPAHLPHIDMLLLSVQPEHFCLLWYRMQTKMSQISGQPDRLQQVSQEFSSTDPLVCSVKYKEKVNPLL